jgi:hypothetical protein
MKKIEHGDALAQFYFAITEPTTIENGKNPLQFNS